MAKFKAVIQHRDATNKVVRKSFDDVASARRHYVEVLQRARCESMHPYLTSLVNVLDVFPVAKYITTGN